MRSQLVSTQRAEQRGPLECPTKKLKASYLEAARLFSSGAEALTKGASLALLSLRAKGSPACSSRDNGPTVALLLQSSAAQSGLETAEYRVAGPLQQEGAPRMQAPRTMRERQAIYRCVAKDSEI